MSNFLDPAILFFVFGAFAGGVKSNLEIPQPIARFLSLYLLMALGLKGGFALHKSGFTLEIGLALGLAVFLALIIPMMGYLVIRTKLNNYDSAAIAATYGSVSAVTFITATQSLEQNGIAFGGHMAAAMALMESPAIIFAILLANKARASSTDTHKSMGIAKILHESFTDGAQLLLLGSMLVGLISGDSGQKIMAPFSIDLFKGMLAFFLLDMGLMAAKNFEGLKGKPPITLLYAIGAPLVHASIALVFCKLLGLSLGDTVLLMVLAASASYIAVPAVLRHALPEVNPALYMGMSLGITFPFNIILGIPLYAYVAKLTY
ncbi:MAG: sodium-dependent bicarbonate transport family permease [Betaproteobacteria bacterium]|nr:sodium-dependent bicarbonate transport family permease [Betaproteobacteria bacterium]